MTREAREPWVAVVGSSNTDLVARVDRLPGPGETVLGTDFTRVAGGKGANQAVAAARSGARVSFIGCVGDDEFGRVALAGLAHENIDVSGVHVEPGKPSGVALITVDESGQNCIAVAPGANACLTTGHVEASRRAIAQADVCLIQLEIPLPAVSRAAELAREAGTHVILNPAPAAPLSAGLLRNLTTIVPNESETACLTGIRPSTRKDAERAADALLDRGVATVVLTLGERGALVATPEGAAFVPAHRVEAVDTTAAGDAFCGALATATGEGRAVLDAVGFACAAAALAVTVRGAQPSMPDRDKIVGFNFK